MLNVEPKANIVWSLKNHQEKTETWKKSQIIWIKMKKMIINPYSNVLLLSVTTFIIFHVFTKNNMKTNSLILPEKQFKTSKFLQVQQMLSYLDVLLIIVKSVMEQNKQYLLLKQVNASSALKHIMKSQNACQLLNSSKLWKTFTSAVSI